MRFLDASQVHALLDFAGLVEALEQGHRAPPPDSERLLMSHRGPGDEADHFVLLPAWQGGEALGIKVATVFPGNLSKADALPSVQAVYLLFDGRDGRPTACIDGTALTYRKTAADSALGARLLARADPETMLMVGAGGLAPYLIEAHRAVRPSLERVLVWNRNAARARALAGQLTPLGLAAEVADDLEAAVRGADLISCATASTEPLVKGAWLKPGAHLDLVGGFTPTMREADDEAARLARVFVDNRLSTVAETGDIAGPIAAGAIDESDVLADLFQLCQSAQAGRKTGEEITLFKNGGGAHLDLMTARFLLSRAEAT